MIHIVVSHFYVTLALILDVFFVRGNRKFTNTELKQEVIDVEKTSRRSCCSRQTDHKLTQVYRNRDSFIRSRSATAFTTVIYIHMTTRTTTTRGIAFFCLFSRLFQCHIDSLPRCRSTFIDMDHPKNRCYDRCVPPCYPDSQRARYNTDSYNNGNYNCQL